MSIPLKPWEVSNSLGQMNSPLYIPNTDRLHSTAVPFPGSGGGITGSNLPPPVPPRPQQTRPIYSSYNRGSMMPYSSPYGGGYGYGSYSHSAYSPYNYGGGGYGAGMYGTRPYYGAGGYEQGGEPSFSQLAEESSASAFQSIESFVSAFGSISMMLESTFHALFSSFRAVVGVADHLGRIKQVFSALAIFRFFKWMSRRIMYLIGISKIKPETIESLWSEVAQNFPQSSEDINDIFSKEDGAKPSSWPILMFLGFIFAGPYLMWKLVKSFNLDGSQAGHNNKAWATGDSEHFIAEVKFPFDAANGRELNLKSGQTIRLAPAKFQPNDVRGWALGSDGAKVGLVPLNYIQVLGKGSINKAHVNSTNISNTHTGSIVPRQMPSSRPRVRFDLNPKPPESETMKLNAEPTSILVHNENYQNVEVDDDGASKSNNADNDSTLSKKIA